MSLTEAFYRRLYSAHEPSETEEFYAANQKRDKNGRWTRSGGGKSTHLEPTTNKIWSGVSAHPDRRTPPHSDLSFPIEKQDYELQREANFRFARSVYDTDLGGGYRSSVNQVETNTPRGEMTIRGVLTYKGREVGTFDRTIVVEGKGKVSVDHTELMIDSAHRSKGLADRFNSHAVARYQELGVDRITLHAGDSVGGFAWARQGFRWATPEIAVRDGKRALDLVDANTKHMPKIPEAEKKRIFKETNALRKALDAGEDVQPIHIASIGERSARFNTYDEGQSRTSWPGKQAMLHTSWLGVYYFDANAAVTAAASSLEHAALRPQFRAVSAAEPRETSTEEVSAALEEFRYDPRQPRDKEGQWATTGGNTSFVPTDRTDGARNDQRPNSRAAMNGTNEPLTFLPSATLDLREVRAVEDYMGVGIVFNSQLRAGTVTSNQGKIDALDDAFAQSPGLTEDTTVYRLVPRALTENPKGPGWGDAPAFTDAGYLSTTYNSQTLPAISATLGYDMSHEVIAITVPAGTKALHVSDERFQNEILLPRGGTVTPDGHGGWRFET